jgi:hypothetical protein
MIKIAAATIMRKFLGSNFIGGLLRLFNQSNRPTLGKLRADYFQVKNRMKFCKLAVPENGGIFNQLPFGTPFFQNPEKKEGRLPLA